MNGQALDALNEAIARTLAVLRIFAVVFEVVVIAAWHSWYFTPAHLVVPVVAAVWGVVFAVGCLRGGLTGKIAAGDFVVALLLAATAPQSVPLESLDGGTNWLLIRLIGTSVAVAWCVPRGLWLASTGVLSAAVAASYLASGAPPGKVGTAVALLVGSSVLFTIASKVPRRGALEADAALAQAGRRWHLQAVATARHRDLRENERVLHDTVLNTLTGLGWGASGSSEDVIRARCRQSVAVCLDLLAGEDDIDVGLQARLDEVLEEARRDGLRVEASVAGQLDVPVEVGSALAAAVREALSNVRRHAGTLRAWMNVRVHGGEVWIAVRDQGVGFDPLTSAPDRLGLRNSIMERIADVGGSADVRTTPGRGTTVELHWSPHPDPVSEPAVLAETGLLETAYAQDLARAVGVGALIWQGGLGLLLISRIVSYENPSVVLGAWALSLFALAWCVVCAVAALGGPRRTTTARLRTARLRTAWLRTSLFTTALLTLAVVTAQIAVGLSARHGDLASLNWVILVADGAVCFLTVTRPAREWLPAAMLMAGVAVAAVSQRHGASLTVVTRVGGLLYAMAAFQVALSMFSRVRRATIAVTIRATRAAANLAAERAAAVAVRHDRRLRLRQLAGGPLPLLTDIGAGLVDPFDPATRRRCASCAAALRRTLNRQLTPGALITALEPAIRAAEGRGAYVEVQIGGQADGMPGRVEEQVVHAVNGILAGIGGGRVLVTLVGDALEGSLIVAFAAPEPGVPAPRVPEAALEGVPGGNRWIQVVEEAEEDQICVEIGWGSSRLDEAPR